MVNQIEFPYDEPDGTVVATDNPDIEAAYNAVVERAIPNSAYAGAVERRLERLDGQRRVRRDAVPGAGCSASSRATRPTSPAGTSPTLPERRRQLGRLVPDRSGQRQERRGGARARRLADRSRARRSRRSSNAGTFPSQIEALRATRRSPTRRTRTSTTRRPARSSLTVPRRSRSAPTRARTTSSTTTALQDAITRVFDGTRRPADRVGHLRG